MMQESGYYQRDKTRWRTLYWTVREIIQWTLAITRGNHLLQAIAKEQIIFSQVRFLFCSIFPPRTSICIEYSFTSVTCIKFRELVRKWHHNSDDSTDIVLVIIINIIGCLLQFNIKLCNSSSAMVFIFCCPDSRPDDLFSLVKVWICWCTSVFFSKHLIELSPILSSTVGQIVKTKFRVNLKYNKELRRK